jgi:hypothetical protein
MNTEDQELIDAVYYVFGTTAACSRIMFATGLGAVAHLTGREINEKLKNDVMNILQNMPSTID